MTDERYEIHTLEWRGMLIEALEPARVPLPVTETGYRSHFTSPEEIAEAGGPVPFIRAALDDAAKDPAWKAHEAAARQYSLF